MANQFQMVSPSFLANLIQARNNFLVLEEGDDEYLVASEWLEKKMPIASQGRIDWAAIREKSCFSWSSSSDLVSHLDQLITQENLSGDVFVLWTNALKKPIKTSVPIVKYFAVAIFEEDWDTWIFSSEDDWCIEVFHDGDICFAKAK